MSRSPFALRSARPLTALAALCASVTLGCAPEARFVVREAEIVSNNGVSLNGVSLNGVSLNGVSLNGVSLNGVSLNGTSLNGVSLNGTKLQFSGMSSVTGIQGAKLNGQLSNGSTLSLRIDTARQGASPNTDVHFYKVSYFADSIWKPLCGSAGGVAVEAIPLAGRWDYSQGTTTGGSWLNESNTFTFACVNTALGKCVDLGYKPWTSRSGTALRPFHQACTRMLRADYCGNGTPYTLDGTTLNLYDKLGVQVDTEAWLAEAEWNDRGATCVQETTALRLQLLGIATPACVASRVSSSCGVAFSSDDGSLLMTEYVQFVALEADPLDPGTPGLPVYE